MNTPNQTPEQHQAVARAEAIRGCCQPPRSSLPKLLAADVHLKYRGQIPGAATCHSTASLPMDIIDGRILLHPLASALAGDTSPVRSKLSR